MRRSMSMRTSGCSTCSKPKGGHTVLIEHPTACHVLQACRSLACMAGRPGAAVRNRALCLTAADRPQLKTTCLVLAQVGHPEGEAPQPVVASVHGQHLAAGAGGKDRDRCGSEQTEPPAQSRDTTRLAAHRTQACGSLAAACGWWLSDKAVCKRQATTRPHKCAHRTQPNCPQQGVVSSAAHLKRMVVERPEELEMRAKTRPSRLPCIIRLTSTWGAGGAG